MDLKDKDCLTVNSEEDGTTKIRFDATEGSCLQVSVLKDGVVELNFTETQGSSSFYYRSDGDSFIIPGLWINQTSGMLKSYGISQLG
jgi:hypothetical protein